MPNKKKSVAYTPGSLQQALKEIREGKIPIRVASRKFGIPRCTLQDRLSGRRTDKLKKQGPDPVLGEEGEKKVVEWLINIAKCGFPFKKQELLNTIQEIIKDLEIPNPFTDDRPGQTWYLKFLKRHPEISFRYAEGNKAGPKVTEESIRLWFRELELFLAQEGHSDVLKEPKRIFNGDESVFSLCPNTGEVLGPKGYRNLYQFKAGNEKDNLTVLATFNASGEMCPPLVVFPYTTPPESVTDSMPHKWSLGRSESGWINRDIFFEYITNAFNNWIIENEIKKPILLLVDGHKSHNMSISLSSVCEELGIILYALPPNATHMLQPADVSVFAPLKAEWKCHVRLFLAKPENFNKTVTKTNFCLLFKDIIENPQLKINIVDGFRRCGLFPYDPNAVDYTKCVQNKLEQFSRPTGSRVTAGITNGDLIAARKVICHLRPVLKQKKIDTTFILKEIKKLRSEPRGPQDITGSENNTNSNLDVTSVGALDKNNLLPNVLAHTSANSNLAPPHVSEFSIEFEFSDVTSANLPCHANLV